MWLTLCLPLFYHLICIALSTLKIYRCIVFREKSKNLKYLKTSLSNREVMDNKDKKKVKRKKTKEIDRVPDKDLPSPSELIYHLYPIVRQDLFAYQSYVSYYRSRRERRE